MHCLLHSAFELHVLLSVPNRHLYIAVILTEALRPGEREQTSGSPDVAQLASLLVRMLTSGLWPQALVNNYHEQAGIEAHLFD